MTKRTTRKAAPAPKRPKRCTLPIASIRTDGGTQPRADRDDDLIKEYAEAVADGAVFPPVIVFRDEDDQHWLADGHHRLPAHARADREDIEADVYKGSQRDAILYSLGANGDHGKRRGASDKRRSVRKMLTDPEWSKWSDREIARQCKVSHPFVAKLRAESSGNDSRCGTRLVTRGGTTYSMDTEAIGAAGDGNASTSEGGGDVPLAPAAWALTPDRDGDTWWVAIRRSKKWELFYWVSIMRVPRVETDDPDFELDPDTGRGGGPDGTDFGSHWSLEKPVYGKFLGTVLERIGVPVSELEWRETNPEELLPWSTIVPPLVTEGIWAWGT